MTTSGGGISVLLNTGDGTFEAALGYRGSSNYANVAVGDLNGDARADIVAAAGSGDDEAAGLRELAVLLGKPGLCNVQNLSRLTLAAATQQLARANCRVGKVVSKYSKTVKQGREIAQSPGFGAVLPGGGKVNLVMSRGKR